MANLGLEEAGVRLKKGGAIDVDEFSQTSVRDGEGCWWEWIHTHARGDSNTAGAAALELPPCSPRRRQHLTGPATEAASAGAKGVWATGDVTDRLALTPTPYATPTCTGSKRVGHR